MFNGSQCMTLLCDRDAINTPNKFLNALETVEFKQSHLSITGVNGSFINHNVCMYMLKEQKLN